MFGLISTCSRQSIGVLFSVLATVAFCQSAIGQVIEPMPPSSAPTPAGGNPFAQPSIPVNAPIIQGVPGSEPVPATDTPPLFSDALTTATVQERMKSLESNPDLDKATKDKLTEQYQQALADLAEAANQEAKAAEYISKMQSIPQQMEAAQKQKKNSPEKPPKVEIPNALPLSQMQQEVGTKEDALATSKKRLDEAVNSLKTITTSRGELSQARKSYQDRSSETDQQLRNLVVNENPTPQMLAERTQLRARWQLLQAHLKRIDKEEAWKQARTELLPLERDLAALEVARLENEVQQWRAAVERERQAELDRQKAQAEAQARRALTFKKYESIAEHANDIVELAERRQTTASRIPELVEQLDETTAEYHTVRENYEQSLERVNAAGDTMNVGILLRIQQKKLPDVRLLTQHIHSRQSEIQKTQLASYEVNDRGKELANVPKAAEKLLAELVPQPDDQERAKLKTFVEELLETEKSHLDNLNADYNELLDKLWKLDKVEKQLIEETEAYSHFISEHVLWIRSTDPIWSFSFASFRDSFTWLLHWEEWAQVVTVLANDFWSRPAAWLLACGVFGLLVIQHRKLKKQIHETGKTLNKTSLTEFRPTLRVLGATFVIALIWPSILCWVGYRLTRQYDAPMSVSAAGTALFVLGMMFFPVELLKQSCRSNGLVQSHFRWPAPVVTMIRRNLRWLKLVAPPFALVAVIFHSAGTEARDAHESLGRLCFVISLLSAALFLHRVLRPSGAVFRALVANQPHGWIERLKYVLYAGGVLIPVALAGLAITGFHYTAEQLIARFYATALLVLAVLLIDALIQRWLLITRRRFALEELKAKREAANANPGTETAQLASATPVPSSQSPVMANPADVSEDRFDVAAMNDQTRHLIRSVLSVAIVVGLWAVWVDVLPALAVLKKVKIHALTIDRVVEEPVAGPSVAPASETTDQDAPADGAPTETAPETVQKTIKVPITLADLLLSVILFVVAIGASKNLPGMLEMVVLQRLPIDNAARYAITTLAQYGLLIFGVSASFYVAGLRWENVQWLAAALMVGLGFGLQEIFANFFSGLIVLLERPVRVGDIVTIGGTTGIVTRIRMRATTITNWERQEMIIPNKDLITGTVLNWTLSDTVQRVFIPVGVAYGSDTDLATETLHRVLHEHPEVLEEPKPMVTFAGFGDSTLNFEVRCFLATAAVKLATIHELHTAIDKAFRQADIEIAFPQCDLHIRTVESQIRVEDVGNSASAA